MKLRLPHKFQAALLAAIASVSFTTLSTGTLGAAFFVSGQAFAEDAEEEPSATIDIGDTNLDAQAAMEEEEGTAEKEPGSAPINEAGFNGGPGNNAGLLATESVDIDETALDTVAGSGQQDTVSGTADATPADDLGFTANPYATGSDTSNGSDDFSLTGTAPAAAYVPGQTGISAEEGDSAAGTGSGSSSNKTTTGAIGSIGGTGSGAIGGSAARPMALTAPNMLSPVSSLSVGGSSLGGGSGYLPELATLGATTVTSVSSPTSANATGWFTHKDGTWTFSDSYSGSKESPATFSFEEAGTTITFGDNSRAKYAFAVTLDASALSVSGNTILFKGGNLTGFGMKADRSLTETWQTNATWGDTNYDLPSTGTITIVHSTGNSGATFGVYDASGNELLWNNKATGLKGAPGNTNFTIDSALQSSLVAVAVWQTDDWLSQQNSQAAAQAMADFPLVIVDYTWNGTSADYAWSDSVWDTATETNQQFGTYGNAVFTSKGNSTVVIDSAVSAHNVTVGGQDYTFSMSGNGSLSTRGINIASGSSLTVNGDAVTTGGLSGAGSLIKTGDGTMTVNGDNTGYTGNITVNAGTLSITKAASLGTGTTTVGQDAVIEVTNDNMANVGTLTVAGNGTVRLVSTARSQSGNALGTVSAGNLELADNSGHSGRYYYGGSTDLSGVGLLHFAGGQLWLGSTMTFEGDVTFGATTYTESGQPALTGSAMRISANGTFSGNVLIQNDTKLAWSSSSTIEMSGTMTGTGRLDLVSQSGDGIFKVSGNASGYTGAITTDSRITLNVAQGGNLSLGAGSNLQGAVNVSGGTLELTSSVNTGAFSMSGGTLKLADGVTFTSSGAISLTGGMLDLSSVTLSQGTYTLATSTTGNINYTGVDFTLAGGYDKSQYILGTTGNALTLTFNDTPVPPPAPPTDLGKVMYVGDSITDGVTGGSVHAKSWRYSFFQVLADNGIGQVEEGYFQHHQSSGAIPDGQTATYGDHTFQNTHSAQASARSYEVAGTSGPSQARFDRSYIKNWLGQDPTKKNGQAYPADKPVYSGADAPNTYFMLLGTNDLLSDPSGSSNVSASHYDTVLSRMFGYNEGQFDGTTGTFDVIWKSMTDARSDAKLIILEMPTWSPSRSGNHDATSDFNYLTQFNQKLHEWVSSKGSSNITVVNPNLGMTDVANTEKPGAGVVNMFINDGLHPSAQGELLMAGNVAKQLGYAGRSVGLDRADKTSEEAQWGTADSSTITVNPGTTLTFAPDAFTRKDGYVVDFGAAYGDGSDSGWDKSNALTIKIGDGTRTGTLSVGEAYIKWGDTILYSRDNQTEANLRIAYVNSSVDPTDNVAAGYYVWLGDQLIGEGLVATTGSGLLNGIELTSTGVSGTVTNLSWSDTAYAPLSSGVVNPEDSFHLVQVDPGVMVWKGGDGNWTPEANWHTVDDPTVPVAFQQGSAVIFEKGESNVTLQTNTNADTMTLQSGAVVKVDKNGHTFTTALAGEGTYDQTGKTLDGVSLSDSWTGAVRLKDQTYEDGNSTWMQPMSRTGATSISWLEMNGFKGYDRSWASSASWGDLTANIRLTDNGSKPAWEFTAKAGSLYHTYATGKWEGSGTFLMSGGEGNQSQGIRYTGDISGWNGKLAANAPGRRVATFAGQAQVVNAAIEKQGTGALDIIVGAGTTFATTFNNSIDASSMEVKANATATIAGDTTLESITGSGAIVVDTDGVLSLTGTSNSYTGALTLNRGATLEFAGAEKLSTGAFTLASGSILDLANISAVTDPAASITLATTTGVVGSTDAVVLKNLHAPDGYKGVLGTSGNNLVLTFAEAADLIWDNAAGDNKWNVATTQNWHADGSGPGTSQFTQNDNVIFQSDTWAPQLQQDVMAGTMTLQSGANVTVNTNNHDLTVAALESNGGSLVKSEAGKATFGKGAQLNLSKLETSGGTTVFEGRVSVTGANDTKYWVNFNANTELMDGFSFSGSSTNNYAFLVGSNATVTLHGDTDISNYLIGPAAGTKVVLAEDATLSVKSFMNSVNVNSNGQLEMQRGSELTINGGVLNATGVTSDGATLRLNNNASVSLHAGGYQPIQEFDLGNVVIGNDSATITTASSGHGGTVKLDTITGSGTLNLKAQAASSARNTFSIGGNAENTTFTGKIALERLSSGNNRTMLAEFNDAVSAAGAVVEVSLANYNSGNSNAVGVGINADLVKMKGLNDGTGISNASSYALFSGSATSLADTANAGAAGYLDKASDGKHRTLEFTGTAAGDSYSTGIKVLGGVDMKMSGAGSQSFTGDLSQMNGAVTASAGTLTLNNGSATDGSLTSVTVNGGTLVLDGMNVTGTTTVSSGTLSVLDGATFDGDFSVSGGATLKLATMDGAAITSSGNFTLASGSILDLRSLSGITGEETSITLVNGGTIDSSYLDSVQVLLDGSITKQSHLEQQGNSLVLTFTQPEPAKDLIWDGGSETWDAGTTMHWHEAESTEHVAFSNNDNAIFDSASANATATMSGDVTAASMMVENGANVTIVTSEGNTLAVTGGITVEQGGVLAQQGTGLSGTLHGAGTYSLESGVSTLSGVTVGNSDWTGTVKLTDVDIQNIDLNTYGHAGSKVEFDGVSGHFKNQNGAKFTPTLVLSGSGLTVNNAYSNYEYIFEGGVEGAGNINATYAKGGTNNKFTFKGSVKDWTGAVTVASGKEVTLKFADDADTVNATIGQASGGGTINLEVGNGDTFSTTFNKAINASSLTVADHATATLNGQTTVATINGDGDITVSQTGSLALTSSTASALGGALTVEGTLKLSTLDSAALTVGSLSLANGSKLDLSALNLSGGTQTLTLVQGGEIDDTYLNFVDLYFGPGLTVDSATLGVQENNLVLTVTMPEILVWDNDAATGEWTPGANWHMASVPDDHIAFETGKHVRFESAATVALTEDITAGQMKISGNSNVTVNTAGYDLEVGALVASGATLTEQGNGTITVTGDTLLTNVEQQAGTLQLNGNTEITGKVHQASGILSVGDGEHQVVAEINHLELGDKISKDTSELNIAEGAVLKVTGNTNQHTGTYKNSSIILGEWASSTATTVNGSFLAKDADIQGGDKGGTISIGAQGTLAALGIRFQNNETTKRFDINNSGLLVVGEDGILAQQLNMADGSTLGTYASAMEVTGPVTLTGNTTVETGLYEFAADGNSIALAGSGSSTITMSGAISGAGNLNKTGEGTLVLSGNNDGLTGNITVNSGTLELGSSTALGTGAVTMGADATLVLGAIDSPYTTGSLSMDSGSTLDLSAADNLDIDSEYTLVSTTGGVTKGDVELVLSDPTLSARAMLDIVGNDLVLYFNTSDLVWNGTDATWSTGESDKNWYDMDVYPDEKVPAAFTNGQTVMFDSASNGKTATLGSDVNTDKVTVSGASVTIDADTRALSIEELKVNRGSELTLDASTGGSVSLVNNASVDKDSRLVIADASLANVLAKTNGISGTAVVGNGSDAIEITLGNQQYTAANIEVADNATLNIGWHNSGTANVANTLTVKGGGRVNLTAGDSLGWGNNGTKKIVLEGTPATSEAAAKLATMNVSNKQTMSTVLEMRGNALVSGSGALEIFNDGNATGKIVATGTNNTIESGVRLRSATSEISVGEAGALTISGNVVNGENGANAKLTKTGTGALTLSGNNTYTGGTVVSAGILTAASQNALGTGAVTVNQGATLEFLTSTAPATVGGLTANSGSTIMLTGMDDDAISTTGTFTLASGSILDLTGFGDRITGLESEPITLVKGGDGITITEDYLDSVTISFLHKLPLEAQLSVRDNNLVLTFVDTLTWDNSTGDNLWSTASGETNWHPGNATSNHVAFTPEYNVRFTSSTSAPVELAEDTVAGRMNITGGYTVQLDEQGHRLDLTSVSGIRATLELSDSSKESTGTAIVEKDVELKNLTVKDNAALEIKGTTTIGTTINVANGGELTLDGNVTATTLTANGAESRVVLNSDSSTPTETVVTTMNIQNGATVEAEGTTLLQKLAVSNGGNLVNTGTLKVNEKNKTTVSGTSSITGSGSMETAGIQLADSSTLTIGGGQSVEILTSTGITGGKGTGETGSTLALGDASLTANSSSWTIANTVDSVELTDAVNGTKFSPVDHTITINTTVTGDGKLVKTGNGTLELSGTNSYEGGTLVNAGTLLVSSANALPGSVTVAQGASLAFSSGLKTPAVVNDLTFAAGSTLRLGAEEMLTTTGTITMADHSTLDLSAVTFDPDTEEYTLATGGTFALNPEAITLTFEHGEHPKKGTNPYLEIVDLEQGGQQLLLHYELNEPTGMVWNGGEGIWDVENEASWHDASVSPPYTPENSTTFATYDDVTFANPGEGVGASLVHVTDNVWATNMYIQAGTDAAHKNVVTYDVASGKDLTVDFVYAEANTGIIKTGAGSSTIGVKDEQFGADMTVLNGTLTAQYIDMDANDTDMDVTGSLIRQGGTLNVLVGDGYHDTNLTFTEDAQVQNVSRIETNEKGNVVFKGDTSITAAGGNPVIHAADGTEIRLEGKTQITASNMVYEGNGSVYIGPNTTMSQSGGSHHDLKDNVSVEIEKLTTTSDTTFAMDDGTSLTIGELTLNKASGAQVFYSGYKITPGETDRQHVTIEKLIVNGAGGTKSIGSISSRYLGRNEQQNGDYYVDTLLCVKDPDTGENVPATFMLANYARYDWADDSDVPEVLFLGGSGESDFTGTIMASDWNVNGVYSGKADARKDTVIILRDETVASNAVIDFDVKGTYSDFGLGIDADNVQVIGIRGTKLPGDDTFTIFSGSMGSKLDDTYQSDETVRTLELLTDSEDYKSSAGIDRNLNIKKTGEGKQTFTGDSSKFDADVDVEGGVLEMLNNTSLTVEDLTIAGEKMLAVKSGAEDSASGTVTVSGSLVAKGGSTAVEEGTASKLDANLSLASGSVINMSAAGGEGGLDLCGNSLTLQPGAQLSSADLANIRRLQWGDAYDLAFNISSLTMGDKTYTGDTPIEWDKISADTYFTNLEKDDYYICYTGSGIGQSAGGNVGTFYILKLPEPTTSTLSLLALAALAARRRRK